MALYKYANYYYYYYLLQIEEINATLHANSIAGALYKNKFANSETPRERSVSTAVSTAGQTMTEPEKSSDLGEISAVKVRLGVG